MAVQPTKPGSVLSLSWRLVVKSRARTVSVGISTVWVFVILAALLVSHASAKTLTIGTGSRGGVYVALGYGICDAVEKSFREISCNVVRTKGSIDNLIGIAKGEFDLGVVQSDIQYHAVTGTGTFKNIGALPTVRSLFSAHPESLAVMTKKDSGIEGLADLPGQRVDIGKVMSGTNATMRLLFEAMGVPLTAFRDIATLDVKDQYDAICGRDVTITAYLAGHPNANIKKLVQLCDVTFVGVAGSVVDQLIASNPYYVKTHIPKTAYDGMDRDVPTIGLLATVMTSDKLDFVIAYALTKAVFENLEHVRSKHLSLRSLDPLVMARNGMTARRHSGAEKYLNEAGLLP